MLVITVARKPLEGTVARNALKWGCGGINIDGTRIAHGADVDMDAVQRQGAQSEVYLGGAKPGDVIAMYKPGGRWPANLVLSHMGECQRAGTREVRRDLRDATANVIAGEGRFGNMGGSKALGTVQETLDTWQCQPGCPVAALDEQSGIVQTGTWNRQTDTAPPFGNAKDTPYETWQESPKEAPAGASRYFKVVQR